MSKNLDINFFMWYNKNKEVIMDQKEYYRQKAIYAKYLYDNNLPFVKVYAPVRDGDKFIVLRKTTDKGISYHLSGGGVDEGETLEQAIKRELMEELNVEVEVVREIGVYNDLYKTWRLDGEEFDVKYEIHVFDTRLKRQLGGDFGLEGEFSNKNMSVVRIDKQTMLDTVDEFNKFGMTFEK